MLLTGKYRQERLKEFGGWKVIISLYNLLQFSKRNITWILFRILLFLTWFMQQKCLNIAQIEIGFDE